MKVSVLRLGHRFERDKRISTHLALTARAFGASLFLLDARDDRVGESIEKVVSSWGGSFSIDYIKNYKTVISSFKGEIIHLTMYGLDLDATMPEITKSKKDKLVIVGGKKVPSDVYALADYNVSVGHQPHSEVSALAVFLDRLYGGEELNKAFAGGKRIIPQARGKKLLKD